MDNKFHNNDGEREDERVIENEPDPYEEYVVREVANTAHNHFYVESVNQDKNSELLSCECTGCPAGISIDSNKFKIKDGKVVENS